MVKAYNCVECGENQVTEFYPSNKSRCKSCYKKRQATLYRPNREKQREYYQQWYTKRGRKRANNYKDTILIWQSKHQDIRRTMSKVARAIKKGLLERPLKCAFCGRIRRRINGHHEDYNFPYDVIWLCSSCHKKIHLGIRLDKH